MNRGSIFPAVAGCLLFIAVVVISGCSSEPIIFRTAEISPPPQILVGVDRNRFFEAYPGANLEQLLLLAIDYGITFYGDDVYAPKWTGSGLDFKDPDRVVPQLLAHNKAGNLWFWFPVNDHSTDKLQATYDHWTAKGWFNASNWFFFLSGISDEVRTVEEIEINNAIYAQYKLQFPKVKWVVTREITQFNDKYPKALGDIFLPMFHMFEVEKAYFQGIGSSADEAYAGVILGGYVSGDTDDPQSMEPGWYFTTWKKYFTGDPPNVPVLSLAEAGDIVPYCRTNELKFFLFWDLLGLVDNVNGTPKPNDIVFKLLGY